MVEEDLSPKKNLKNFLPTLFSLCGQNDNFGESDK